MNTVFVNSNWLSQITNKNTFYFLFFLEEGFLLFIKFLEVPLFVSEKEGLGSSDVLVCIKANLLKEPSICNSNSLASILKIFID